jgi:hypothetical protein
MNTDYAAALALFLVEKTGSCIGLWKGTLPAKDQRALFGRFLGKGRLTINGATETLRHTVKRGFGTDFEVTANLTWREVV